MGVSAVRAAQAKNLRYAALGEELQATQACPSDSIDSRFPFLKLTSRSFPVRFGRSIVFFELSIISARPCLNPSQSILSLLTQAAHVDAFLDSFREKLAEFAKKRGKPARVLIRTCSK